MKQKYSKKEAQQQKRKEKKKDAGKGFGCRGAGLRREWGLGRCGEGTSPWGMVVEQMETWKVAVAWGRQVDKWEARRPGYGRPEAALSSQQEVPMGGAGAGTRGGDLHLSEAP